MSSKLQEFLISLNSDSPDCVLFVNPDNYDDFKLASSSARYDDLVKVSSVTDVSFGFQSEVDVLRDFLKHGYTYNQKFSICNVARMVDLYFEDALDGEFKMFLMDAIESGCQTTAEIEASFFIEQTLPDILSSMLENHCC